MIPGSPKFQTESVAKANKRRDYVRIFSASILASLTIGLTNGSSPAGIARIVLIDGIPFGFVLLFVTQGILRIKFRSFGQALIVRSVAFTLLFVVAVMLAAASVGSAGQYLSVFVHSSRNRILTLILMGAFYLQVLLMTGLKGVSRKLGPGAFWNWIRGYYYTPKEEERIFMFLDMRRSTELAEKLGDLKFSKLVRDFFDDLTGPILETRAEVSHYIGDEAVLTWWPNNGLPEARCLQIFFRMQLVIEQRRAYYQKEYGVVPEFKAGAHIGRVVATEVGSIKSEIVFHGDVLNTTARVQSACSEFGADFLITEALANRLPTTDWLTLEPIGDVALKGKSEKVPLLSASVKIK